MLKIERLHLNPADQGKGYEKLEAEGEDAVSKLAGRLATESIPGSFIIKDGTDAERAAFHKKYDTLFTLIESEATGIPLPEELIAFSRKDNVGLAEVIRRNHGGVISDADLRRELKEWYDNLHKDEDEEV